MKLPEKLGIAGTSISVFGIAFGWGIFPWLLKMQIGKIKGLAPGSESREMWEKIPFAFDFQIYIFNVTNHMAIQQKGEIPAVEEVGPYHYDEWKEKAELIDYEDDDSVSFHMKNTYIFNKQKTAPLTGDETIIIPHPLLVGLIMATEKDKAGVLPLVNKAIPILFNKPESIFIQTTVKKLLFEGIVFNCTTKDFAASAVCAVLKKESSDLEVVKGSVFKFSLFNMKNGTKDPNKFLVIRGTNDYTKVGEVIAINGKKKLSNWRGRPCNTIEGSDSTIFPPDVKPENDILSFNMELCKTVPAKYVNKTEYSGIPTLRYNVSLGDMSTDPALKCLCADDNSCLKKGVMDLMKCTGLPLIISLPHFYDSHEDYLNGVKGLSPDPDKHSIYLDIEPMTGTPLYAKKRVMFSFPLHKVNKIDITQTLPTTFLPLLWVEEAVEIPSNLIQKIDNELFFILRIVDVVKWGITILGALIMSGGVGLYYKGQNSNVQDSPKSTGSHKAASTDFLANKFTQNYEMGNQNTGYM